MRHWQVSRTVLWSALVLAAAGCGGGGGGTGPLQDPSTPVDPPNAAPSLGTVPDQDIAEDGLAGPIKVVISDAETDASALDFGVSSSDASLLPDDGIDVSGEGGERTLYLIPAAGQTGSTTVTLTVTDEEGASTSSSFRLVVSPLFRAEFSAWLRETVLARGEFDAPVGEPHDDGTPLPDLEDILRIAFSDETAEDPAAYDDLLPPG